MREALMPGLEKWNIINFAFLIKINYGALTHVGYKNKYSLATCLMSGFVSTGD